MGAPGFSDSIVCPKCFVSLARGTEYCPDCGAAISSGSEGSDTEVYQELARTNLLRMRGAYKEAVDVCLGILRRFPNNVTAHTLLGDIYAEQGDLKQATEWYEMALDLNPDSQTDRDKLQKVRDRIGEREAAATAKQLGIPQEAPKNKSYGIIMAVAIVAVGAAAFGLGNFVSKNKVAEKPELINTPVNIQPDQDQAERPTTPNAGTANPAPSTAGPLAEDDSALATLKSRAEKGALIIQAVTDPRGPYLTITANASDTETPAQVAASIAVDAYGLLGSNRLITIRIVRGGALLLVADVKREAFDAFKANADGKSLDQIAAELLIDAYPSLPSNGIQPTTGTTGTTGTATTGDTTN